MNNMPLTLACLLVLFVSSCSNISKPPQDKQTSNGKPLLEIPINHGLFPNIGSTALNQKDIFFLTLEQQEELSIIFNKKIAMGYEPHKALSEVLALYFRT